MKIPILHKIKSARLWQTALVSLAAVPALSCGGASARDDNPAAIVQKPRGTVADHTIQHDDMTRRYLVYKPAGYDGTEPLPVVLNFHGGAGNPETHRLQTQMDVVADEHKFLVVYPAGSARFGRRFLTFNAGRCCGYAKSAAIDDVDFVRKLLDDLPRHYKIDTRRIYATGMSNGAMMAYRLACELPDRIAAIGPVSGGLAMDGAKSSRPMPIIHFHGMLDPNYPYAGGIGKRSLQRTPHRSIPDTIEFWRKANGCPQKPNQRKEKEFVLERYDPTDAKAGAPIVIYRLPGGGHTWPGGVDVSAALGTGPLVKAVNASEIMWKFFEKHQLPEKGLQP